MLGPPPAQGGGRGRGAAQPRSLPCAGGCARVRRGSRRGRRCAGQGVSSCSGCGETPVGRVRCARAEPQGWGWVPPAWGSPLHCVLGADGWLAAPSQLSQGSVLGALITPVRVISAQTHLQTGIQVLSGAGDTAALHLAGRAGSGLRGTPWAGGREGRGAGTLGQGWQGGSSGPRPSAQGCVRVRRVAEMGSGPGTDGR